MLKRANVHLIKLIASSLRLRKRMLCQKSLSAIYEDKTAAGAHVFMKSL